MRHKSELLIIEAPGISSLLYAWLRRKKYEQTVYIHDTRLSGFFRPGTWIKKLEYADIPGSFFEVGEEGYSRGLDAIAEKYPGNLYATIAQRFCGDPLYRYALKKEIFNRYTEKRMKSYTFLLRLIEDLKNRSVVFVPADNEDVTAFFPEAAQQKGAWHVPPFFRIKNRIESLLASGIFYLLFPAFLAGVAAKNASRGLKLSVQKKEYPFALDIYNPGINRKKRGYNAFFLYDRGMFHHSKILHVIRNRFDNSAGAGQTREFYENYDFPYVESDTIPVPVRYYLETVIRDLVIRSIIDAIKGIFSEKNHRILIPALAVMKMKIDAEIFYLHYDVRVFIMRDEYSPFHIARTLVAHSAGNKTFGFSHGDDCHHSGYINCIVCSTFGLWSTYYRRHLAKALEHTKTEIIGAGIYGLDKTHAWEGEGRIPQKYREIAKNHQIILIFGSSFSPDLYITRELTLEFYKTILDLTDAYTDAIRVIKPKGDEFEDPDFKEVIRGHERVILEDSVWTYRVLPVADLVICINVSTIGLEALMTGKKVLYYDVTANRHHAYAAYSEYLVAFDPETMKRNIHRILVDGEYIDPDLITTIRHEHGFRYDGRVAERVREICRRLAEDTRKIR